MAGVEVSSADGDAFTFASIFTLGFTFHNGVITLLMGLLFWPARIFHPAILAALLGVLPHSPVTLPTRSSTVLLCLSVVHNLLLLLDFSFSLQFVTVAA